MELTYDQAKHIADFLFGFYVEKDSLDEMYNEYCETHSQYESFVEYLTKNFYFNDKEIKRIEGLKDENV